MVRGLQPGISKIVVFNRFEKDDYGFDKTEVEKVELFLFKNFEIPEFPRGELIKQLCVT